MAILSSDVLRGHVEAIILNSLSDGKKYGYEIRGFIESKSKVLYKPNEQSVYSALHRMEGCGYIKGNWGDERMGATRKYYEMTEEGKAMLENKRTEWEAAKMVIDALLSRD